MLRRFLLLVLLLCAPLVASAASLEKLTLGGGCFWCLEAVFDELNGVTSVVSGFAGGRVPSPSYTQVSAGGTGHAEVVDITFDPAIVSRDTILKAFFTIHDPTTLNRQGNDVGEQYRSIAFYRNDQQKAAIEHAIEDARHEWKDPIVTEVEPFKIFYKAENYHQEYFRLHGEEPYCQLVIAPKVAKFRKLFHDRLKR